MPEELSFKDDAAAEYDRAFAHVTAYFMPFLSRAANLASGMRIRALKKYGYWPQVAAQSAPIATTAS
jgi:hypothetical protein